MKKTFLGILGAIILGALGSALWELVKPGFSFLSSTVVTVTSFGINSLIDDIYIRAGRADLAVLSIKIAVGFASCFLSGLYGFSLFLKSYQADWPKTNSEKRSLYISRGLFLLCVFLLSMPWRQVQVILTRKRFDVFRRASAPYFTEEERLRIDSQLALVTGKDEFEKLMEELRRKLYENGVQVRED